MNISKGFSEFYKLKFNLDEQNCVLFHLGND